MLTGVKGTLASLGGCAALDTGSAPWSEQLWAMGGRVGSGLRVSLNIVLDCTTSPSSADAFAPLSNVATSHFRTPLRFQLSRVLCHPQIARRYPP